MRRLRKDSKAEEPNRTSKHVMLDALPHNQDHLDEAGRNYLPAALSFKDIDDVMGDAAFWESQREVFLQAIGAIPDEILQQGIEAARSLGLAVDFDLTNEAVLRFAKTYINDWWKGLNRTQRNVLRAALRAHIATGGTLESLAAKIAPLFGEGRAMTIAVTETTRLFAEGNLAAYRTAGVTHVEWQTVKDTRVDPICEALQGKRWRVDNVGETPPAHPRCRCFLSPIVGGPKGRALVTRVQEA